MAQVAGAYATVDALWSQIKPRKAPRSPLSHVMQLKPLWWAPA